MAVIRKLWKENLCYQSLLLVLMLLMLVPYLHQELAPLAKIFLIWGYAYIGYDFVTAKTLGKCRSLFLLLGFCVSYGISALLDGGQGLGTNLKACAYMALFFVLFCGGSAAKTEEEKEKQFRFLCRVILTVTGVLSMVCLVTWFLSVSTLYVMKDGSLGYLGIIDDRLWGLYNANTGGALNALSIVLLLGLMLKKPGNEKKWIRVPDGLNLVLQTGCLALTGSRTSLFSLVLVLGAAAFLRRPGGKKKMGRVRCFLLRILAGLIAVMVSFMVIQMIGGILRALPRCSVVNAAQFRELPDQKSASAAAAFPEASGKETSIPEVESSDGMIHSPVKAGSGVLTGRPILWKAGFQAFLEHPFFGVTREGLNAAVEPKLSDPEWIPDLRAGGVHNGYLTVLISSGLVGASFLLLYGIQGGIKGLHYFRMRQTYPWYAGVALASVGLMLIMELMEARVLYHINFFLVFFWIMVGYALYPLEVSHEKAS